MIRNFRLRPHRSGGVNLQILSPNTDNWFNVIDFRPDGKILRCGSISRNIGLDVDNLGRIRYA